MANKMTVGELVYKISGDMDNLKTELAKTQKELDKVQKEMEKGTKTSDKMSKGFLSLKNAVVGFVSGALLRLIGGMVKSGAELESLRGSFNQLTADIGLSSDEVLDSLNRLSGGTIAQKDLVTSANRAMVLGVAKNMDEFNTLMQTARLRARDMGLTTTQAFNDIVTGIGRGSPLILDNLGFVVSATQAQTEYAKQLGVTVDQLTEAQKKEALKASILAQGNEEIAKAGEITNNYSDRIQQVNTIITDLKDNIGRALLPAMASLLDTTLENNETLRLTSEEIDKLGKSFYQISQGIITVARIFANAFNSIKVVIIGFVTGVANAYKVFLKATRAVFKVVGKDTEKIEAQIQTVDYAIEGLGEQFNDTTDKMFKNNQKLGDSLRETFDPQGYKGLGDTELTARIDAISNATENAGDQVQATSEDLNEFQGKLVDIIDKSKDVRDALDKDLTDSFSSFSSSLNDNIEETNKSLAKLVVDAENNLASLREKLSQEQDAGARSDIEKQIAEQEKILQARAGFEERQAQRIADIRAKFEEAGIDASKAGLDSLVNTRTLEQQIEEERRLASLDEFTRFEEQQAKKLLVLADNFIAEVTLIKNKIETQESYEKDLTEYLASEESKRLTNTEVWAQKTISKYNEVATALQNFLSLQSRVSGLSASVQTPTAPSNIPGGGQVAQSSITNNNVTNNTPINVNANVESTVDINAIGQELSWQLGNQ